MSVNKENQELEYYTLMVRKLVKERGCSTWRTVKIIEIQDDKIVFGMSKIHGRMVISKVSLLK